MMYDLCKGDKLLRQPETNGTRADRGLVIEGKKYYTKFKTY